MNNATIPDLFEAHPLDLAFLELQVILKGGLPWLKTAYGKAETKVFNDEKQKEVAPAIYSGGNDYQKLFPDEHLGNFSFFNTVDGRETAFERQGSEGKADFSLIIWFDFKTVYPNTHEQRNVRHVIKQVTDLLRKSALVNSSIRIGKVFEEGKNIYKEYSDKEIETQFLMRPYGGFRLEGLIHYYGNEFCNVLDSIPKGIGVMQIGNNFIVS